MDVINDSLKHPVFFNRVPVKFVSYSRLLEAKACRNHRSKKTVVLLPDPYTL